MSILLKKHLEKCNTKPALESHDSLTVDELEGGGRKVTITIDKDDPNPEETIKSIMALVKQQEPEAVVEVVQDVETSDYSTAESVGTINSLLNDDVNIEGKVIALESLIQAFESFDSLGEKDAIYADMILSNVAHGSDVTSSDFIPGLESYESGNDLPTTRLVPALEGLLDEGKKVISNLIDWIVEFFQGLFDQTKRLEKAQEKAFIKVNAAKWEEVDKTGDQSASKYARMFPTVYANKPSIDVKMLISGLEQFYKTYDSYTKDVVPVLVESADKSVKFLDKMSSMDAKSVGSHIDPRNEVYFNSAIDAIKETAPFYNAIKEFAGNKEEIPLLNGKFIHLNIPDINNAKNTPSVERMESILAGLGQPAESRAIIAAVILAELKISIDGTVMNDKGRISTVTNKDEAIKLLNVNRDLLKSVISFNKENIDFIKALKGKFSVFTEIANDIKRGFSRQDSIEKYHTAKYSYDATGRRAQRHEIEFLINNMQKETDKLYSAYVKWLAKPAPQMTSMATSAISTVHRYIDDSLSGVDKLKVEKV